MTSRLSKDGLSMFAKIVLAVLLFFVAAIGLSACGKSAESQAVRVASGRISIECPADWQTEDASDGKYVYPSYGGLIYMKDDGEYTIMESSKEAFLQRFAEGMEADGSTITDPANAEWYSVGDATAFRMALEYTYDDGTKYQGWVEVVLSGTDAYSVLFIVPYDDYSARREDIKTVLASIEVDGAEKALLY